MVEGIGFGRSGCRYVAVIGYDYQVNGISYAGNRIRFGSYRPNQRYSTSDEAQAVIKRYPIGLAVNVFYDPADPHNAVLEPGIVRTKVGACIVGAAFLALGFVGLFKRSKAP